MIQWLKTGLLSLFAVACATATRVDYEHEPTKDLQDRYAIEDASYDPFRKNGVVVYPFFKLTEGTKQMVVVRVASGEKKPVHLTGCTVAGKSLDVDQVIQLDKEPKPGVHRGAHVVAKLEGSEIEKLSGGKDFAMRVDFQVGTSGKKDSLTFDIKRVETTQLVSH